VAHLLVISDTHLGEDQAPLLIERIRSHLSVAGAILHAGDITSIGVLSALSEFAPVHAVLGNNDFGVRLPAQRIVEIDGCTIGMVHDSGPATGRGRRLHHIFPTADVVVFGHSHAPWNEIDVRADGHVQRAVNPGSAMQRRMQPNCTIAWLDVDAGAIDVRHVVV
jgi:uncharacterized protein